MLITWDETKRLANLEKHGFDFADLTLEFFAASTVYPARSGRLLALGYLHEGIAVAVIFAPLGTKAISVISMRRASSMERSLL